MGDANFPGIAKFNNRLVITKEINIPKGILQSIVFVIKRNIPPISKSKNEVSPIAQLVLPKNI